MKQGSPKEVSIMASALAERLDKIKELGGITGRDVAQLMDTTPETVSVTQPIGSGMMDYWYLPPDVAAGGTS